MFEGDQFLTESGQNNIVLHYPLKITTDSIIVHLKYN